LRRRSRVSDVHRSGGPGDRERDIGNRTDRDDCEDPETRREEDQMDISRIVSRPEWLAARKELLIEEKAFTRQRDALSARRRELPMVRIDKTYIFDVPNGPTGLPELFDGRPQLILYHFMFDPGWDEGCKSCSFFADNFTGAILHLAAANTAFAVVSKAPLAKLEAFKKRMGWTFPWVSSFASDFNYDFSVTLDEAHGADEYNYHQAAALKQAGKIWIEKGELPGLSVFLREGDDIFHTYSTYQRGLDLFLNTFNFLDVTPLGRQEDRPMTWVRHHDQYGAHAEAVRART
jgi:predicted dithiol-disulfide oxidoreductase (DUF899 family)